MFTDVVLDVCEPTWNVILFPFISVTLYVVSPTTKFAIFLDGSVFSPVVLSVELVCVVFSVVCVFSVAYVLSVDAVLSVEAVLSVLFFSSSSIV